MGFRSMKHFPFFFFEKFRLRRHIETKKPLVMHEDQRRQRMDVNYAAYLLGDEALTTQIIGHPIQVENQSYADSVSNKSAHSEEVLSHGTTAIEPLSFSCKSPTFSFSSSSSSSHPPWPWTIDTTPLLIP